MTKDEKRGAIVIIIILLLIYFVFIKKGKDGLTFYKRKIKPLISPQTPAINYNNQMGAPTLNTGSGAIPIAGTPAITKFINDGFYIPQTPAPATTTTATTTSATPLGKVVNRQSQVPSIPLSLKGQSNLQTFQKPF